SCRSYISTCMSVSGYKPSDVRNLTTDLMINWVTMSQTDMESGSAYYKDTTTGQYEICPKGYYCDGENKMACTGITYSDTLGAKTCKTCPTPKIHQQEWINNTATATYTRYSTKGEWGTTEIGEINNIRIAYYTDQNAPAHDTPDRCDVWFKISMTDNTRTVTGSNNYGLCLNPDDPTDKKNCTNYPVQYTTSPQPVIVHCYYNHNIGDYWETEDIFGSCRLENIACAEGYVVTNKTETDLTRYPVNGEVWGGSAGKRFDASWATGVKISEYCIPQESHPAWKPGAIIRGNTDSDGNQILGNEYDSTGNKI
ncbi:MAG: hypothetical protein MJ158_00160, partial [Alphaproteobacteria bacterium]|nr:hypothetical protein [Alphaproteobacteria bacterium]